MKISKTISASLLIINAIITSVNAAPENQTNVENSSQIKALEKFISSVKSAKSTFTQTSINSNKPNAKAKMQSGEFYFQRPNKFKFEYKKPFEQNIIADGKTLWLHDKDINQITKKNQDEILANTPAAIISSVNNIKDLEKQFKLTPQNIGEDNKESFILAEPKKNSENQSFKNILIGLKETKLTTLEITDIFGQKSILKFNNFEENPNLPAEIFKFTPPAGVDILE